MRHHLCIAGSLALSLTAGPAMAQFGNPAGMLPGTVESQPGTPAPNQANAQDRLFIKLVGMGNAGEVELARLADSRGASAASKAYARRMAQDHATAATRLAGVARPLNIAVPNEPDPDQKATRARLDGLQGAALDAAYLQSQLIDHQKTVQLLQWEISNGQDASVQAYAKEMLPIVLDHLRTAQGLLAETTGAGPQGLAKTQPLAPATAPPRR